MLSIISGVALIAVTSFGFWSLLPRDGRVHATVDKFDGGSMITIAIMTAFTFGVAMLCAGLFS
jgi:hypothetical protein